MPEQHGRVGVGRIHPQRVFRQFDRLLVGAGCKLCSPLGKAASVTQAAPGLVIIRSELDCPLIHLDGLFEAAEKEEGRSHVGVCEL